MDDKLTDIVDNLGLEELRELLIYVKESIEYEEGMIK